MYSPILQNIDNLFETVFQQTLADESCIELTPQRLTISLLPMSVTVMAACLDSDQMLINSDS